ncbi:MAG: DUF2239 family protein [Myxococcota bacterium]|nr:DUF2239 family protein [Myxococcota bacterium]
MNDDPTYTAFAGERLLVSGDLRALLGRTKQWLDANESLPENTERERVLIFEDQTGREVDFDFSGSLTDVLDRAVPVVAPTPRPARGRPKLGVVSREVSLLPRHWEWLERQPNGISAALRRLVDEAKKREPEKERARRARDAASRVMSVMGGNRPGFEEATRALFAGEMTRFEELVRDWPADIRAHVWRLIGPADQPAHTP